MKYLVACVYADLRHPVGDLFERFTPAMRQEYAEGRNPSTEQLEVLVYGVDDPTQDPPEIPESLKKEFPHITKALDDLYT